ncbi:glycosyltransferase [Iamia majanohamensis]|uniref:Glycosyltransferase n=1 Tax=Iamia majanohamensis TaxID=467976 RepID=A0AAE9Y821_9ACTN|nr:glycosyltransferase [Iamia majanohamensis]WCO68509.1 glycosyltransferase [Iamia majanohamensis]
MTAAPPPADESAPAATADPPVAGGAPAVVAVVVTRDPGPWFEEVLRSLAAQTYQSLSVLVVDAGSEEDPAPRVAAVLPRARVARQEGATGYGAAANRVLEAVEGAAFYLLCHDDVALAPDAVRHLVEEAFRTNGGVLGPKLLDWHDPRRIRSVGGAIDKVGAPAPAAEPGELDQEQHDAVRDVFYVAGGATLVRADLFRTLGGFDPGMTLHGDDVDLCWRAHIAGARVVVVPAAQARHLEALAERHPDDDRRRLQQRHRVRSLLTNYGPVHLLRVVPQALVLTLLEAVFAVVGGRFRHGAEVVAAWTWNLGHLGGLRRRRKANKAIRSVRDREVRELQVRGSARLTAFLRGQVGPADDRLGALAETGRDLSSALRTPLTRVAVAAAGFTLLLMFLGSRNLLFQPLPSVGELNAFPDSALELLRTHLSGWRTTAGGGTAPSPTGDGVFGLLGLASLGSMGLARKIAILGLLPAGPLGIWRLSRPIGSIRAAAAAVVVYTAVPLPYNALADGSWAALAAYAVVPWIVLGLARSMRLAPWGRLDLDDADTAHSVPPVSGLARVLGLGLAIALGAIVTPAIVPLAALVAVGLALGSLVAGRLAGVVRMLGTAVGGIAVALVLHLPWTFSLLADGGSWAAVVGADEQASRSLGQLLRFQTGPYGDTPFAWAFLVAAALPLVIGRGWRLAWAVRAWFTALAGWAVLVAVDEGWVTIPLPASEVLLAPAAVGLALSAGLGMAAFEVDLRHFRFGWRQLASVVAAAAVIVGGLGLVSGSFDGRWKVPRGDLNRALAPVLTADGDPEAEVLWLGDPDLLPLGAHDYRDDVALATSEGLPDVRSRWAGPRFASTDRLDQALDLAVDRRTARLGRILGPQGVRYVVVPTSEVPEAFGGSDRPPPPWLVDALEAQLDLEQVDTDRSLLVYRNTAWRGEVTAVPSGTELPDAPSGAAATDPEGWEDVAGEPEVGRVPFTAPGDTDVVAAVPADDGWSMTVEGGEVEADEAYGWALRAPDVAAGPGEVSYATGWGLRALVLLQPVLWVLVLLARNRAMARARGHDRDVAPVPEPATPEVDPVESAAAAVAGLAERTAAARRDGTDDTEEPARRRGGRRRRRKGSP